MARKTKIWTVQADNRDKGKRFFLQEKSAFEAEKWATRAFLAITRSGYQVPPDIAGSGMAGLASILFQALPSVQYEEVQPLLDEMLACARIMPDERNPQVTREMVESDFEEVSTIWQLRWEIWVLHTGFSWPGKTSTLIPEMPGPGSFNAQTFPVQSPP